jgi:hypothetical protein
MLAGLGQVRGAVVTHDEAHGGSGSHEPLLAALPTRASRPHDTDEFGFARLAPPRQVRRVHAVVQQRVRQQSNRGPASMARRPSRWHRRRGGRRSGPTRSNADRRARRWSRVACAPAPSVIAVGISLRLQCGFPEPLHVRKAGPAWVLREAASWRSSFSRCHRSSWSMKATNSPVATDTPRLRADAGPPRSFLRYRTRPSYRAMTPDDPSVEPSSIARSRSQYGSDRGRSARPRRGDARR